MGGSYAQALSDEGYEVGAVARRRETLDYALEKGWIAHGVTEVTAEYMKKFDISVFALYPHIFVEWIEKYQNCLKPGAVITDVTGVKGCVVYKIQEMLRPDVEFIAAHPMAGREKSGIEYASKEIFRQANYIVTPTEKNTAQAVEICKSLGETLGFKTVTTLSPEEHDEMIGFLSQLTHCIAVSLMTCRDTDGFEKYTGDSFRDLTRIANINDVMWSELFLLNKKELLKQMELFENAFANLKKTVENNDIDEMRSLMRKSTEHRKCFEKEGK
ncbi:MAG: prephenate dehydrogenase [Clostridia bacterium]|nr:prephenate dehydrogenase [Clostridia bacterium]